MVRVFHITKNNASLYQRHITFLRISMLALTHPLTHSSVAPLLLFLPPQSDVADIYASSVKAHHTHCICICLCIWCISLKPPCRPIRCASRGEICHNQCDQLVVSNFCHWLVCISSECVLSHNLHRNFKYTYSFCNFTHMCRDFFLKLKSYLREVLSKIGKI